MKQELYSVYQYKEFIVYVMTLIKVDIKKSNP